MKSIFKDWLFAVIGDYSEQSITALQSEAVTKENLQTALAMAALR